MSKRHKGPDRSKRAERTQPEREQRPDQVVEAQRFLGNAMMAESLRTEASGVRGQEASHLATAQLALCVAPPRADQTRRHLQILERSALPEDHVQALSLRLASDEALAEQVSAAVRDHAGVDDPTARRALRVQLADIDRHLQTAGSLESAAERAGARSALPLIRAFARLWFDEEEEEVPVHYAERSGA